MQLQGGMTTRRPSWQHTAVATALRFTGPSTPGSLHRFIARRDASWTPPTPPARLLDGVQARWSDDVGWPVWTLSPARHARGKRTAVIAVHGGAYVRELDARHWAFYTALVRYAGVDVVIPVYPLAPHGTAATVVPLIADVIERQITRYGADDVGLEGDSAGAGLALAAVHELVRRGSGIPKRMVLVSPWLDAALSDPRSRRVRDPILGVDYLREAGRLWAGDLDPADPRVSPLNGDFEVLPYTSVYAGSLDVLFPDALRLRSRLRSDEIDASFDLRRGLIHNWPSIGFLPEAREIRGRILEQLIGARPTRA